MVPDMDVAVSIVRPGVMVALGLGYEELSRRNPRLVYAVGSGDGQNGPCDVLGGAGGRAAEYARGAGRARASPGLVAGPTARLARFRPGSPASWMAARRALRKLAASTLVVLRRAERLESMLAEVRCLRQRLGAGVDVLTSRTWVHALETDNLLLTAQVMAGAALLRRESRGRHFREDHPDRDDRAWLASIVWKRDNGEPVPAPGRSTAIGERPRRPPRPRATMPARHRRVPRLRPVPVRHGRPVRGRRRLSHA
jgi:hypothetical protein